MATLIAVYNSDGCVGRCDAKCYDAKEPDCDCICRGMNHGGGERTARENTRELAGHWIEKYREEHPESRLNFELEPLELALNDAPKRRGIW